MIKLSLYNMFVSVFLLSALAQAQAGDRARSDLNEFFSSGAGFAMPLKTPALPEFWKQMKKGLGVTPEEDPETTARRQAQQDSVISSCLNDPRVPEDKEVEVFYHARHSCGLLGAGNNVHYRATKERDVIRIRMGIYFKFEGGKWERKRARKAVHKLPECIKKFYARQGLLVEMTPYFDLGPQGREMADLAVDTQPKDGNWRADAEHWEVHDCKTCLHEFGHLLGLPDEYEDGACPNRTYIGETDSLMRNPDHRRAKLYSRHIKTITDPLCVPGFLEAMEKEKIENRRFSREYHEYWDNKRKERESKEDL
ncbi:hypothetical protein ACFL6Y_11750 [Elusimicrobiota bacterium]